MSLNPRRVEQNYIKNTPVVLPILNKNHNRLKSSWVMIGNPNKQTDKQNENTT